MRKLFILFSISLFLFSCKKKEVSKSPSYNKGEISIYTDDAYLSVVEALAGGYEMHYPETKITVKTEKEDLAFMDLLKGKVKMIAMLNAGRGDCSIECAGHLMHLPFLMFHMEPNKPRPRGGGAFSCYGPGFTGSAI